MKDSALLKTALNDKIRVENGLIVVFVTKNKYPEVKAWHNHAQESQTDKEIRTLYHKRSSENTAYSYFTWIGGFIDIDILKEMCWNSSKNSFHVVKQRYYVFIMIHLLCVTVLVKQIKNSMKN